MPHGRNHGNTRPIDGTDDDLLIECPEILCTPAAASNDQDIHRIFFIEKRHGICNLLRRPCALHQNGMEYKLHARPAPLGDIVDIAQHRPCRRRDNPDASRKARQRLFMPFIKESLGGKAVAHLLKGEGECPRPLRCQGADIELICSVALIDRDIAARNHLHPVLGRKAQISRIAVEHDTLHACACIF